MSAGESKDVLLVDVNDESLALSQIYDHDFPFGESKASFDEEFWKEVKDENDENEDIDRVTALRIVRIRRLANKCDGDILVDLITKKHDDYLSWCQKNENMDKYPTFVFELSQLAEIVLKEDFKSESPKYLLEQHILPDNSRRNIIHLAAQRNLMDLMHMLLMKQKGLAMLTTYPDNHYPLYYALDKNHDEAASKLIQHMPNESVRDLFGDRDYEADELPTFQFCNVISQGGMKKTVEAILDCLMNPDWPFMPLPDDDKDEFVLPNMPFRYHFYYRLLDGDDNGQPGKTEDGKVNPNFNLDKTKSCLQLLSEHSSSEDVVIRHPVVRMLMRSKWTRFGKLWVTMNCIYYILFLTVLSVALLCQSSTPDRNEYSTDLDYFRLFCEIVTLLLTLGFITTEVNEAIKGKMAYLYDPFNYLDVAGLLLILAVIPLRLLKCHSAEYAISAAAYLINFLRVSKCATAFKSMSVYAKTISTIITQDITRFAMLWGVSLLSFSGAAYLILKASKTDVILSTYNSSAYWHVLLQEVRSLAESNGFAETEEYNSFHVAVTIFLMLNMFFCIVLLNNILIAQIGNSYSAALSDAKIKFDIERTKMVTRVESQVFCLPWCLRSANYVDKEFLNNEALEADLLENWAMLKDRSDSNEKRKQDIKSMITDKLKTK